MINTLVKRVYKLLQGIEQGAAKVTLERLGKQNLPGETEINQGKREMQRQRGRKACEVLIFHFD